MTERKHERFGARVLRLRTKKGWSLSELSRRCGGHPCLQYLSELEKGYQDNPSLRMVEALAHALGVSPIKLAGWGRGKGILVERAEKH